MTKKKSKVEQQEQDARKTISFEESLEHLKDVVNQLEDGNLTLSESLEKYEQGVKNLNGCYQALAQVQQKIELLVDLDEDGNLITQPFDGAATQQPSRKMTRSADVKEDGASGNEVSTEDDNGAEDDIDDPHSLF